MVNYFDEKMEITRGLEHDYLNFLTRYSVVLTGKVPRSVLIAMRNSAKRDEKFYKSNGNIFNSFPQSTQKLYSAMMKKLNETIELTNSQLEEFTEEDGI